MALKNIWYLTDLLQGTFFRDILLSFGQEPGYILWFFSLPFQFPSSNLESLTCLVIVQKAADGYVSFPCSTLTVSPELQNSRH